MTSPSLIICLIDSHWHPWIQASFRACEDLDLAHQRKLKQSYCISFVRPSTNMQLLKWIRTTSCNNKDSSTTSSSSSITSRPNPSQHRIDGVVHSPSDAQRQTLPTAWKKTILSTCQPCTIHSSPSTAWSRSADSLMKSVAYWRVKDINHLSKSVDLLVRHWPNQFAMQIAIAALCVARQNVCHPRTRETCSRMTRPRTGLLLQQRQVPPRATHPNDPTVSKPMPRYCREARVLPNVWGPCCPIVSKHQRRLHQCYRMKIQHLAKPTRVQQSTSLTLQSPRIHSRRRQWIYFDPTRLPIEDTAISSSSSNRKGLLHHPLPLHLTQKTNPISSQARRLHQITVVVEGDSLKKVRYIYTWWYILLSNLWIRYSSATKRDPAGTATNTKNEHPSQEFVQF